MTKKQRVLYCTFGVVGILTLLFATGLKSVKMSNALPEYLQLLGITLISLWMPKFVRRFQIISTNILLCAAGAFFLLGLVLALSFSSSTLISWVIISFWSIAILFLLAYADWSDENKKM